MKYLLLIIIVLCSCSKNVRCKVLVNGTNSYVTIPYSQRKIFHNQDTVWLDLATHTINDKGYYTFDTAEMVAKAVIYR